MAGVAMMVRDKYTVRLAQEQREELQRLIRVGKNSARVTARARILLKSDEGWAAPQVAGALACSPPPEGHDHWTLRLLAGKVVELGLTPSMSHEGVRQRLKKKRPQAVAEEGVVHSQGERGICG